MTNPSEESMRKAEEVAVKCLGRVSEQSMGKWLWRNLIKNIAQTIDQAKDEGLQASTVLTGRKGE